MESDPTTPDTAEAIQPGPDRTGRLGRRGKTVAGTDRAGGLLTPEGGGVASMAVTDVGNHQRQARSSRLQRLCTVLGVIAIVLVLRDLFDRSATLPVPHFPASLDPLIPAMALIFILGLVMVVPLLAAGRSPHILFRPDEMTMTFADVRGSEGLVEEVTKTLNLFLAHRRFADEMGGSPRKAILFEGPPGTGKTYMAKAMAAEAGVPFLFVSSSAFQSMFYGQTNRKIRSYFKALRRYARREGGAIGFIEELDAIGAARGTGPNHGEGVPGVVNELLMQLQSFEQHTDVGPPEERAGRHGQHLAARPPAPGPAHDRPGQCPGHRSHQPGVGSGPCPDEAGTLRPHHLLRAARP